MRDLDPTGPAPKGRPDNVVSTGEAGLDRRQLLRRGALFGLTAAGLPAVLAACGGSGGGDTATVVASADATGDLAGTGVAERAVKGAKALGGGTTITLVHPSGNAANFVPFFDEWKKLTGHEVVDYEIPIDQLVQKVFAGATAKTGEWDLVVIQPRLFGDLLGAGAISDISSYVDKYKPEISNAKYGFYRPQDGYATSYGKQIVALDADSDNFIYAYRDDWFGDPKEKQAFKQEYGYDLAPAKTWRQFNDIAKFFTRPDEEIWGAAELISAGWGFWWWELRFASTASPNNYYFEDDMTPRCNTPEGVEALELLVELRDLMPKDVTSWNFTQTYALVAAGQAAQSSAWGSLAKFCNTPGESQVVGKFATALMPGTEVGNSLIQRSLFAFGNSITVWAHSANPEAAYLFSQWITSPEMSGPMVAQPGFSEPYRIGDEKVEAIRDLYTPALMDEWQSIAEHTVPEIMLKGAQEYGEALDQEVNSAFVGNVEPEQAMENVAKAWEGITNRLGRDSQQEAWQFLKQSYPTKI